MLSVMPATRDLSMSLSKILSPTMLLSSFANAREVFEVLAVEYPPFTSDHLSDGGIAFQRLRKAYPENRIKPHIVPPKRAYQMIQNGQWCMRFFPGNEGVDSHKIALSKQKPCF